MADTKLTLIIPGQEPIHMTEAQLSRLTSRAERKDGTMTSNTGTVNVAADQLRSIIERIEAVEEEKKARADDLKEIYSEAKGNGYETKALRRIVRLRKLDGPQKAAHDEVESILETYMSALGML